MRVLTILIVASTFVLADSTQSSAQRGRGRGGDRGDSGGDRGEWRGGGDFGGRGGERGEERSPERRASEASGYFKRLDRNNSGYLEADETRGGAGRFLEGMGFDPSRPISIRSVQAKIDAGLNEQLLAERQKAREENRQVPGFGEEVDLPAVPGFGLDAEDPLAYRGKIEDKYEEDVVSRVKRILDRSDRNENGVLEEDELRRARIGGDVEDFDLNGDGQLVTIELAEMYQRQEDESDARDNRSRNERGRGGDRNEERAAAMARLATEFRRGGGGDFGRGRGGRGRGGDEDSERNRGDDSEENRGDSSRSRVSTSSPTPRVVRVQTQSLDEKVARYVDGFFKRYDSNKDGQLDADEQENMSSKIPDLDEDGIISRDEAAKHFGGAGSGGSSGRGSNSDSEDGVIRESGPWEKVGAANPTGSDRDAELQQKGASASFLDYDQNRDGQIQMAEFETAWNDAKIREFRGMDQNGDGIISLEEFGASGGAGRGAGRSGGRRR